MNRALNTHRSSLIAALALALTISSAGAQGFDHEHKAWTALLKKHVVLIEGDRASRVHYDGFAADRAALKSYLDALAAVRRGEFESWNRRRRMAFLINAYNAHAVEKILTRYPDIRSIWDFGKLTGNPFKERFVTLLGRAFSLDQIEHETLRKPGAYDEPRVHFAVNCASIGCPMLREEAYVAERLEAQLEEQTRRFLSDRSRNRYNPDNGRLEVSRIFEWYRQDWTSGYRGIGGNGPPVRSRKQFLAGYAELLASRPEHQRLVREQKAEIRFLDYDWGLNDAKP